MSAHEKKSDEQSDAILAALGEAIPGFAPRERNVALAGVRRTKGSRDLRADCVGTDRSSRPVLATWTEFEDDEAILWAVEAVASTISMPADAPSRTARSNPHPSGSGQAPLIVLIVRTCSARLLAALSLLPAESFSLLEVHERRSADGAKLSLVRRDLRAEGGSTRHAGNGIEAWPPELRELAESLSVRVRRIDPSIERTESASGLQFCFHEEEAARLSLQSGKLVGAWGTPSETVTIEDDSGADAWLERALRRHAARLRSGTRPTRPADLLSRAGPLLSPEELAAFRDD